MLYIVLTVSIILNTLLLLYATKAARRLFVVDSNIEAIEDTFTSFRAHVDGLYELEMYYGDTSLKTLLDHSRMVLDEIEKYDNLYLLPADVEEDEDVEEEDLEETEEIQLG